MGFETVIGSIITEEILDDDFKIFKEEINDNFIKNYSNIIEDVINKENTELRCSIYCLYAKTHYNKIKNRLERIYKTINN